MMRAYKLRLYPTRTQERALAQWFGHGRWVWNWALEARGKAYRRRGVTLTSVDLSRLLTRIKRSRTRGWLGDVPASCLAQKLCDLDTAYRNVFAGRARLPRFKSRRGPQRVRVEFDHRHAGKVRAWLAGGLVLPGLGGVKLRGRALPKAMPKLVTVSLDVCGRYWVSFAVEETVATPAPAQRASIGVDVGVAHLAVLSTGEAIANPRSLARHLAQLARLSQRIARQCRGSNRRGRTRTRIARLHARIADCRREHLHRLSHRLVSENQVIAIEDLNAEGMGRSAKGTRAAPGRNVRAKAGLNRAVRDAAFGELRRQLTYKGEWYGRTVVAIDRWFASSRLCSGCGAHKGALAPRRAALALRELRDRARPRRERGGQHRGRGPSSFAPGGHRGCARLWRRGGTALGARTRGRVSANRPGGVRCVRNASHRRHGGIPSPRQISPGVP